MSRAIVLKDVNIDNNNKRYTFDRIAELNITTIANKMDMTMSFILKTTCNLLNGN